MGPIWVLSAPEGPHVGPMIEKKNHQIVHCLSSVHFHYHTCDGYWTLLFQLPSPNMHRRMPAVPAQGITQSDMYAGRVPVVPVSPVGATSFHSGQRPPSEIYGGLMVGSAGVLPPFGGATLHSLERPPSPEYGGSAMSAPPPYGSVSMMTWFRADSRFAPSQWETALLCNDVSHWLCTSLESALLFDHKLFNLSVISPEVVVMTTHSATCEDQIDSMKTPGF